MAPYIYQAACIAESVAAQIKNPQDRIKAVRPALEAAGAKNVAAGFPLGKYESFLLVEEPDDTTATSLVLMTAAGGAFSPGGFTRLLSG